MKKSIEKKLETFVYGVLSLMFGAAFFFGVLYPSHGLSPHAYRVTEAAQGCESERLSRSYARPTHSRVRERITEYDKDDIQYTFYLYERLKNS